MGVNTVNVSTYSSAESATLIGSLGADSITGTAGNDMLNGGDPADTLDRWRKCG